MKCLSLSTLFILSFGFAYSLDIIGTWQLINKEKKLNLACSLPVTVHTVLTQHNFIQDPFIGNQESSLSWIEESDWTFEGRYQIHFKDSSEFNQRLSIEFKEVDTYASFYVNDKFIGKSSNFFVPFSLDLTEFLEDNLKKQTIRIRIEFESPVKVGNKLMQSYGRSMTADNDRTEHQISPFIRKPAYHFGWDWAPKFIPIGISQSPIIKWTKSKLPQLGRITVKSISADKAQLQLLISGSEDPNLKLVVTNLSDGRLEVDQIIDKTQSTIDFELVQPKFWWPVGHGKPHLYDFRILLIDDKDTVYQVKQSLGIRTTELIQEKDSLGESFYFKINGQAIFCKGVNYIPQHIFLDQITESDYFHLFEQIKNLNINMIRVWGGGIYERDIFYELCDQHGIMVWQDFMFANTMYPNSKEFINNIEYEIDYQIKRLKHHPCIVHWNGNNEIDVAWHNWGWKETHQLTKKDEKKMKSTYDHIFRKLIPRALNLNGISNYTHSSPLSNWGPNGDLNSGSLHYWGVWHGREEFHSFHNNVGRFVSEFGFQSYPNQKTYDKYDVADSVHSSHTYRQKSYIGDGEIIKHIKIHFDYDSSRFNYLSQLTQALAMEKAFKAHRLSKGKCMGSLMWQLNDCWPGPSWSLIDFDRNEKAAYESVKAINQTVQIIEHIDEKNLTIHAVNDSNTTLKGILELQIKGMDGLTLKSFTKPFELTNSDAQLVKAFDLNHEFGDFDKSSVYCDARIYCNDSLISKRLFFLCDPKHLKLGKPNISIKKTNEGMRITSSTLIYGLEITSNDKTQFVKHLHLEPGQDYLIKGSQDFKLNYYNRK